MLKIKIKTLSGLTEEGWIKSDKDLYYLDNHGALVEWTLAKGDSIMIVEDVDSADVPVAVQASINRHIKDI